MSLYPLVQYHILRRYYALYPPRFSKQQTLVSCPPHRQALPRAFHALLVNPLINDDRWHYQVSTPAKDTNGLESAAATSKLTPSADAKALPILGVTRSRANSLDQAALNRTRDFDDRLTHAIWHLATTNSNPALDLVTCLERRRPIGFRYVDITRAVVIHHGTRDSRVPVENVKWLGRVMKRCEVRVLEGEGHGLMAVAKVMGQVLGEVGREWEDWATVTAGKKERRRHN